MNDVTRILSAIEQGDPNAAEQLLPLVYDELRALAGVSGSEKPGQTLEATALVTGHARLVANEGSTGIAATFFAAAPRRCAAFSSMRLE